MGQFINQVGTDNQLHSSSPKWRQGSSYESRTEENKGWFWRIPKSRTWNILERWMRFHIQQNQPSKNIWSKILCDMKISYSPSGIIGKGCSKSESQIWREFAIQLSNKKVTMKYFKSFLLDSSRTDSVRCNETCKINLCPSQKDMSGKPRTYTSFLILLIHQNLILY